WLAVRPVHAGRPGEQRGAASSAARRAAHRAVRRLREDRCNGRPTWGNGHRVEVQVSFFLANELRRRTFFAASPCPVMDLRRFVFYYYGTPPGFAPNWPKNELIRFTRGQFVS